MTAKMRRIILFIAFIGALALMYYVAISSIDTHVRLHEEAHKQIFYY
jgi:energy-converting hydrogenase Eha subunit E